MIPAILVHWSFNRFSDLGHDGAIYAALAYTLAAMAIILSTKGSLGYRRAASSIDGGIAYSPSNSAVDM